MGAESTWAVALTIMEKLKLPGLFCPIWVDRVGGGAKLCLGAHDLAHRNKTSCLDQRQNLYSFHTKRTYKRWNVMARGLFVGKEPKRLDSECSNGL